MYLRKGSADSSDEDGIKKPALLRVRKDHSSILIQVVFFRGEDKSQNCKFCLRSEC